MSLEYFFSLVGALVLSLLIVGGALILAYWGARQLKEHARRIEQPEVNYQAPRRTWSRKVTTRVFTYADGKIIRYKQDRPLHELNDDFGRGLHSAELVQAQDEVTLQ